MSFTRITFGDPANINNNSDSAVLNVDDPEVWKEFVVLGEWVEKVPQYLKTIGSSLNADDLDKARNELFQPFFTLKEEFVKNNDRNKETILVNLLIRIIDFCWPILKNSETPKRGLLFLTLIKVSQATTIVKSDPTKWMEWHPSAERNLYKATEFIGELIDSAKDDVDMLRCCGLMPVKYHVVSSQDQYTLPPLAAAMQRATDDMTRACFALGIAHIVDRSFSLPKELKQEMRDLLKQHLALSEPLSATRLISAIFLARPMFEEVSIDIVNVLADYMLTAAEMEEYYSHSPLADFINFSKVIHNAISPHPPACDLFLSRALPNLETLDKADSKSLLYGAYLVVKYAMTEVLVEGVKIIDLSAKTVKVLKLLAQLDNVWKLPKFIAKLESKGIPSTKEALQKFIDDTSDDGVKRFPTFDGIDDIQWHDLNHAYGPATDVPKLLRLLASFDIETRASAHEALYSNIYHQGSVFPASPYAVPYLLEMLECSMVQGKADILNLCRDLLVTWASGAFFSQHGFDVDVNYPNNNDEEHVIKHQIEQNIVKGLPIVLNQLTNSSQGVVRACAAHLLAMLPRVATQTVPAIKQQLDVETDMPAEAAMILSLGIILPKLDDRETCLTYFTNKWNAVKDSDKAAVKFCTAACIARLYLDQPQRPPAFVVEQLTHAINDAALAYYAFDDAATLAMGMLPLLKIDEALPLVIQRFNKLEKVFGHMPTIRAMVNLAFRREIEHNKPITPSSITAQQLGVLRALDDKPTLWNYGTAGIYLRKVGLPGSKFEANEFFEKLAAINDMAVE